MKRKKLYAKVLKRKDRGESFVEIGRRYGISRMAARGIYVRADAKRKRPASPDATPWGRRITRATPDGVPMPLVDLSGIPS